MEERALKHKIPFGPPSVPETLKIYIRASDPCFTAFKEDSATNPFFGKKVLVLSGAADNLVPWRHSEAFVDGLNVGPAGRKQVFIQDGVGHTMSPEMLAKAAELVHDWLSEPLRFPVHVKARV